MGGEREREQVEWSVERMPQMTLSRHDCHFGFYVLFSLSVKCYLNGRERREEKLLWRRRYALCCCYQNIERMDWNQWYGIKNMKVIQGVYSDKWKTNKVFQRKQKHTRRKMLEIWMEIKYTYTGCNIIQMNRCRRYIYGIIICKCYIMLSNNNSSSLICSWCVW